MASSLRNRSEFSTKTKAALARRANQRCSFPSCRTPTSGPSEVAPGESLSLGDASHIHAAAPNGPRYLESMTSEERSDITNGIWLCALHNRLVDNDSVRYSADELRTMKAAHEASVTAEIEQRLDVESKKDLIALGPDLVFLGELLGTERNIWQLRIDEFLEGDIHTLINYIETFSAAETYRQYVLVNELGDARILADPPSWKKESAGYVVKAAVKPSAKRINVHHFPADLALGPTHDLSAIGGGFGLVSGFDAFKQRLSTCLSTQKGEMWFHPSFGVRFAEYAHLYEGSVWLPHFIKMEVIRMASIPFSEPGSAPEAPPLQCIRRVHRVDATNHPRDDHWHPFHFELEIEGWGDWKGDVPIHFGTRFPHSDPQPDSNPNQN